MPPPPEDRSPWHPSFLPPPGSSERWPWLQALGRCADLPLEPWLQAFEEHSLPLESDLLGMLVSRLDGAAAARLLAVWLQRAGTRDSETDPTPLALLGRFRDPRCAALLRAALQPAAPLPIALPLLPLLGHQRDPADFPLLRRAALAPGPSSLRRAALEGLAVGLSAWPAVALEEALERLALDLDPALAAQAVDLLARLPTGLSTLRRLAARALDPGVAARLERRLKRAARTPPGPGAGCGAHGPGG